MPTVPDAVTDNDEDDEDEEIAVDLPADPTDLGNSNEDNEEQRFSNEAHQILAVLLRTLVLA